MTMPPSLWTKDNKTYRLFGTTFRMPAPKTNRPLVLLFDIGGVCVGSIDQVASAIVHDTR